MRARVSCRARRPSGSHRRPPRAERPPRENERASSRAAGDRVRTAAALRARPPRRGRSVRSAPVRSRRPPPPAAAAGSLVRPARAGAGAGRRTGAPSSRVRSPRTHTRQLARLNLAVDHLGWTQGAREAKRIDVAGHSVTIPLGVVAPHRLVLSYYTAWFGGESIDSQMTPRRSPPLVCASAPGEEVWVAIATQAANGRFVEERLRDVLFGLVLAAAEAELWEPRADWPSGELAWFEVARLGLREPPS
jgi:hypothetical protein